MSTLALSIQDVPILPVDETLNFLNGLTKEAALSAVKQFSQKESEDWFHIGMLLSAYKNTKNENDWNDLLFYADDNFRINKRKAYYLIRIYENLVKSGITFEQVKMIGWTKLKEIAPLLTADNVEYWSDVAAENTTKKLIALLKSKGTSDPRTSMELDAHLGGEVQSTSSSTTVAVSPLETNSVSEDSKPVTVIEVLPGVKEGLEEITTVTSEPEKNTLEVFDLDHGDFAETNTHHEAVQALSKTLSKYPPELVIKLVSELFPNFKIVFNPI